MRQRPSILKQRKPKSQYCERTHGFFHASKPRVHICIECHYGTKSIVIKCTKCGSTKIKELTPAARMPHKSAPKRTWDIFFKKYAFSSYRCC